MLFTDFLTLTETHGICVTPTYATYHLSEDGTPIGYFKVLQHMFYKDEKRTQTSVISKIEAYPDISKKARTLFTIYGLTHDVNQ